MSQRQVGGAVQRFTVAAAAVTVTLVAAEAPATAQPVGPAGPVELSQPWATPAPLGGDTSVMFTLHNDGDVRDNLLRAACATAESGELMGASQPGAAPAHIDQVGLAPGQQVVFAPDGIHIVLHHLNAPARLGQTLHCTATFARSGERLFEADVRQAAPPPAPPI
jgi:copper(I)-binding protein